LCTSRHKETLKKIAAIAKTPRNFEINVTRFGLAQTSVGGLPLQNSIRAARETDAACPTLAAVKNGHSN
jgi:hypothetical protein